MMDRRRFLLTSLAGALVAPLAAEAQQAGKMYRIGFLQTSLDTPRTNNLEVFRQGLRDLGYVAGQNIVIEYRMSQEPKDNPDLLADLIGRRIDLLVTWSTPALVAAKRATTTILSFAKTSSASFGEPSGSLTTAQNPRCIVRAGRSTGGYRRRWAA
jgi:putative tryptophan/tyrosine transport system substrate-binding protein